MSVKPKQKSCPVGKYWVSPYKRKAIDKNGENGKKIILTCLEFLIFILLGLSDCFGYSFKNLQEKIHAKNICRIKYNFSKTAAIVNPTCGTAIYVNFKTKQIKRLISGWPSAMPIWKSDTIVHIKGSCGTGCSQSIIFMAPSTKIVCPTHEYRIENLNSDKPPDFYNNDPLLIEPYKKMYVCYAENNVIQVFKMPRNLQMTIYPPYGYYAEEAFIRQHHLEILYRNGHENVKKIIYLMKD